ncbi:MAG TPA: PAC2 family protein [Candidatus Nanoarchaeia archaeon]|nr:PAC2 family protein [Candidatus Nanoarchaeia archaeon]
MKIKLHQKPQDVIIIEGFPGFGFVSNIAVEYLIEHLNAVQIGEFVYDDLPATAAIHEGKLVNPMAVFHIPKYNLVVLHTLLNVKGHEWKIAECILHMAQELNAKEILTLEGVAGEEEKPKPYYFGDPKFGKSGAEPVEECVILGVSAALMLRHPHVSCLFVNAHSSFPDSAAAAKLIEVLNKHFGMNLDTKPLLQQAQAFEKKIHRILQESEKTQTELDKKGMSYLG